MSQKGLRFTLEVAGQAPDTLAVTGFTLTERLSLPFTLEADVASTAFHKAADDLLEKQATLRIWQGQTLLRTLAGVVTAFGTRENNHWQMLYRLRIQPPLWRAGLRQNFRIFQQQDIRDITALLLRENGVTAWAARFYEPHPAREFCVQYAETDLAFLTRLWAEEGIFFYDRQACGESGQTLLLCDDVAGLARAAAPFPFNPNITSGVTEPCISEFHHDATVSPSSVMSQDYTFRVPDWPGVYSRQAGEMNGQYAQYEIFDYPGRFKDEQHGLAFTRYKLDGWRNSAGTASGISPSPALYPGIRFALTGHPLSRLDQVWQVVSSTLTGTQPQARHGSQAQGTTLSNRFTAISAGQTWRPKPAAKPKVDGPQSAVVTGPAGEEIFCDEHGRVRVKFLWDRYHGGTPDSSCWIRVSQSWAGTGFGHLAIPRVGQEVIVDFLNGDPDQPVITGRLYHEDNRAPGDLPDTRTQMTLRSKTYKGSGFNELRFDDATNNEQVYLHAQKNMDTEVLNNRTTDVKVNHSETIGNNQNITVGVGQTVNVGKENAGGHDQKVTVAHDQITIITNDQTIEVTQGNQKTDIKKGDQEITIYEGRQITKAKKTITVSSEEKIELICGDSSITLLKSGEITLKGKMIKNIADDEYHVNTKKLSADGSEEQVLTGGMLKLNP
ncbi:type VI secretion system Vgr family protein [Enterobacter sp.]|uniref:type VI secretion system Vgr family protein n=1 Tax=Enterobacter sp. TaxID=42895 RepID=UPI00296F83B5|nr:type VI secretion system tip protein TssI/VgrG [Enterobacter sp.]